MYYLTVDRAYCSAIYSTAGDVADMHRMNPARPAGTPPTARDIRFDPGKVPDKYGSRLGKYGRSALKVQADPGK